MDTIVIITTAKHTVYGIVHTCTAEASSSRNIAPKTHATKDS